MIAAGLVMVLTIAGAIIGVGARRIVHAIFGLGISLAGVALAFGLLRSPFVAAMEVLIYIGGITVAMVFAVMLSSGGRNEPGEGMLRRTLAAGAALLFLVSVGLVISGAEFGPKPEAAEHMWSVQQIGRDLLNRFNVVFELLSVVLLLAIVGAITIAGRGDENLDPAAADEDRA